MPPVTLGATHESIFARVSRTPDVLSLLLAGVDDRDALWKPAQDRFSIVEIIGHLTHADEHAYRRRIECMIAEDTPEVPPYDPDVLAAQGAFHADSLADALKRFREARSKSVGWIAAVPAAAAPRACIHALVGRLTIDEMLHEWPFHDLGHSRQIMEILRARVCYAHIGPFQPYFNLRP